ncbi:MAG: hypothetical protein KDA80_04570 [Planctomycetaceae bacterium]|nr:hypothetical protein [Planctomycetaceae bacterium]
MKLFYRFAVLGWLAAVPFLDRNVWADEIHPQKSGDITAALQQVFDAAGEGAKIQFETGVYHMSGVVRIDKSVRVDFNGSTIIFDNGFREKGFHVSPQAVCEVVEFQNGNFIGDGTLNANKGPVISSYSGCRVGRFVIERCTFRNLTYGCSFNCTHAGVIRNASLTGCLFENIVGNDAERGKGVAFSLNQKEFCAGRSSGNVFINCGRHSVYCSAGGRFLSDGDTCYRNNVGGETNYPLAAFALARGSHIKVTNAYIEGCRDGISVSSGDPSREYSDVVIEDCTFVDNDRYDISLNTDNPEANGLYRNVVVRNTNHTLTSDSGVAVAAWAYQGMRLSGLQIFDERTRDKTTLWLAGRGDSQGISVTDVDITTSKRRGGSGLIYIRPDAGKSIEEWDVRLNGTVYRVNTR